MKCKLIVMIIALLLALTACANRGGETEPGSVPEISALPPDEQPAEIDEPDRAVDYARLPLTYMNHPQEHTQEIDDYFWQMIDDTPQARYMAYTIQLTMVPNGTGNITGDFIGIENAPVQKLIDQAIFHTPPINHFYYTDVHYGEDSQYSYVKNNIVSIIYTEAIKDGLALGDIFYADDIEQTLIFLYGDYQGEGNSYRYHFRSIDGLEYYREEGLFLRRFDLGSTPSIPQILDIQETAESITCDVFIVTHTYRDDDYYEVEYDVELTADNFVQQTAELDVWRFTYHYAEDDGRPILYSVETLGKMGDLMDEYGLPINFHNKK